MEKITTFLFGVAIIGAAISWAVGCYCMLKLKVPLSKRMSLVMWGRAGVASKAFYAFIGFWLFGILVATIGVLTNPTP